MEEQVSKQPETLVPTNLSAKDGATPPRPTLTTHAAHTHATTPLHHAHTTEGQPSTRVTDQGEDHFWLTMDACFKAFDKDEDGFLSQNEFAALCRALFRNERGKPYPVDTAMLDTIFTIFDTNKDHVIDKEEFRYCWQKWIKQVVRPVTALVVVDVQNDFISGSLAISNCPAGQQGEEIPEGQTGAQDAAGISPVDDHTVEQDGDHPQLSSKSGGCGAHAFEDTSGSFFQGPDIFDKFTSKEVIPPINRVLEENRFDMVVYSLDWHPENHVSFIDNVHQRLLHESCKITSDEAKVYDTVIFDIRGDGKQMEQKLWPRHCVQNTWGAELHKDLKIVEDAVFVYKGTDPDTDSYSAFWDNNKISHTSLNEELQKRNVTDVFICGIAYDICVAATTRHAIEEGYRTMLIDDAARGVCDKDIQATKNHTIANNGLIVTSSQIKSLATGRDRPPVLAYRLALELAKKMKKK
ncbi:uncharacterized protein Naam isoform X1 [Cherax quadricarinatus]|uniref:uncharacterized protein Naam isoform X1 n=1 Tax=Cherax quadricarinatus TaxID=27406 RepID=UPI0023781F6F|nr:uncharacterized protein LOC128701580 isoform X1 [Cherax quadricarinatus]